MKLTNFVDIAPLDWPAICEESGLSVGLKGGRRRYAAAFLWAELTGGDWILAPGLQKGNITNLQQVYRQLEKSLFPKMKERLQKYGSKLLSPKKLTDSHAMSLMNTAASE